VFALLVPSCQQVWNKLLTTCNNFVDIIRLVLRFIHFLDKREHAIPFFVATNILPVNILFYENVLTLMHDVKYRAAPVNIVNLFQNTSDIHSYNTRSSKSNNFYIKQSKLEIQRKSFSHVGVKWWNEVPSCIRELPKRAFKKTFGHFTE
jgi:hypothetical protein